MAATTSRASPRSPKKKNLSHHDGHSFAARVCFQGPGHGHDELLQSVQECRAMTEEEEPTSAEKRDSAEQEGEGEAGWDVRVHSLRLLQHVLPQLLVEPRVLSRSRCIGPRE